MKILLEAGPGGHTVEMSRIWPALSDHDLFLITNRASDQVVESLREKLPFRVVFMPRWYTRYTGNMFADYVSSFLIDTLSNFVFLARIMRKEKPRVLISTGCSTSLVNALLARLLGAKVIFVESPARLRSPSFAGRLVYPFASLFLVQWESTLGCYGKRAQYWGSVM